MDRSALTNAIIAKLAEPNQQGGYSALELMRELDSDYSETEVQRSLAMLLTTKRVVLTPGRLLELDTPTTK